MKKKLTVLAIMCVILIVLGGINSNVFFGTQYLTTKPGFGYTVSSGVTWWDCNWSYNKKITIDHTKVQSDQDYFPVLIYESSDPDLVAHAQSDGDDILFVDAGQTVQLHHEIEKYNSVTGELSIWVEVAHLLSTSDTVIYMYYGNPDCSSQQNVEGTWNSNYAMVQHLNETSGTHGDSTSNNNDGTIVGGVTQGTSGRSVLDGSDQFSGGIDQYISFGNQSSLTPSSVTLEAWVKDPPIGGAECYDEKTQILTLDGWKYFSDLTDDDVVLTFNQSTGKQEWQRPLDRAVFNHNGTMYRITTEKGDLLVSPKHNVYAWMGNAASFLNMVQDCSSPQMVNSFASDYDRCSDLSVWNTSIVDNIGTLFCSLNATSSDHIGQWYDNANAKYGSSFVSAPCGESACAFDNNALYSSLGIVRISCLSNESKKLNSGSVRFFEYLKIFPFISVSSFNTKSGDISMQSQLSNSSMRYFRAESGLKKEKSIFASTTRRFGSMLQSPCRFATLRFNSSASLSACSSDNFDLEHMSSAMENSSRRTNSLTTFASAGSNRSFNVDGMWTFTTTSAIHKREYQDYLNVMNFDLTPITDVYEKMQPGEPVFFLDANGTPMSVSSIQKESYDGFIYDVDVPNDIVLVRRGDGSAFWSGNSDSPIDHATHQPMLCYTQKEYTGASAQTVAPENEKDGGGSVDWWNPFSVFKIFTTFLFGDKKPEITPLEPAKLVEVDP
ncbi:MAG: DUF2341 domain-containing protein, partial [Euryarchaeota archaeon]|nr:DUF2341 domain-containing protein [Euryarchaeota archaeon]